MATSLRESPITQIRKDTFENLKILSYARPMQPQLTRLLFKEKSLDKPTQTLLNHLSYYLATIIDPQAASKMIWPLLFDSKAERTFRNELYVFICSDKRLTPVKPGFLVNPGCYKVTVLISQMTSLAMTCLIEQMGNESQKKLLKDIDEAILKEDTLVKLVDKTQLANQKLSNYSISYQYAKKACHKMCTKIIENEKKFQEAETYLNSLVNCIESDIQNDTTKHNNLSIKNVMQENPLLDVYFDHVDSQILKLEEQFQKTIPFIDLCRKLSHIIKKVIMRHIRLMDRNDYVMSYNHNSNNIFTQDLECHVNTKQTYILKNIVVDGILNFPNLIKAFTMFMQHIFKNSEFDNSILTLNKNLETGNLKYREIMDRLLIIMETIKRTDNKVQYTPPMLQSSDYISGSIYPGSLCGPSLTDLKFHSDTQDCSTTFSPLRLQSKYKMNFNRTVNYKELMDRLPPKYNFMESNSNKSVKSNIESNKTIGNLSGFTEQQMQRLFPKKKSNSMKLEYSNCDSEVSKELTRSYSSPNISNNNDRTTRVPELSFMLDDHDEYGFLELAGTSGMCDNSNIFSRGNFNTENTIKIIVTDNDLNTCSEEIIILPTHYLESKSTPKPTTLEKIIQRLKKEKASVIPTKQSSNEPEVKAEEKVPSLSFSEDSLIFLETFNINLDESA